MFQNINIISEQINIKQGKVIGFGDQQMILVELQDYENPIQCSVLMMNKKELSDFDIGDDVLAIFDSVEMKGYILGFICNIKELRDKTGETIEEGYDKLEINLKQKPTDLNVNGKKITLEADDELHLKCGKSSVLLKKNGKIIIRGTDLVSRSSGTNKIKGAAVAIN